MTLLFTYSRGSYLSFIACIIYFAIKTKKIKFLVILIFLILTIFLLPRPSGEGVRLERIITIKERISSMNTGLEIFKKYPIFGIGFNYTRYYMRQMHVSDWETNHARSGFDNSFIFIMATTGIFGLISYLLFLKSVFGELNIYGKTVFIAFLIHSLSINSGFFPFTLYFFISIIILNSNNNSYF
jgi:O-antigen ligase